MVTEEQAARLPWDSFLDAFADGPDARRMVEGFREIEWPNIKRELGSEAFQWQIPDGLEPIGSPLVRLCIGKPRL